MIDICCNYECWVSYGDGYGYCACDGETRFCTQRCPYTSSFGILEESCGDG